MPTLATAVKPATVEELLEFVRPRHNVVLTTFRKDGSLQQSPVSAGVDAQGRIVISTYPERAKAKNLRRDPRASVMVLSDSWDGAYVQVNGEAEVLDMPEAEDAFVDYYRCIAGEHPDWNEYRAAMHKQNKSLLRITITSWGPIATGGFPPNRAPAK